LQLRWTHRDHVHWRRGGSRQITAKFGPLLVPSLWLSIVDNTNARCHPTSKAKLLLGLHLPSLYFGRGHVMRSLAVVPSDEEGVYETSLLTESEYTAIVQPHKTTSTAAVLPHLSSYADYVCVMPGQYGIALHQDPTTGGQLILDGWSQTTTFRHA